MRRVMQLEERGRRESFRIKSDVRDGVVMLDRPLAVGNVFCMTYKKGDCE